MRNRLIIFIFALTIVSCDKDNPVSGESESDKMLYQQIVGTWGFGTKTTYHFNADRTWIDSVFTKYADSSDYTLLCVVEGKYQIKNNVLYYSDLHIKYSDKYFGELVAEGVEISIDGNKMSYQTVEVYSPLQTFQAEIFGSWAKIKWVASKSSLSSQVYEGRQKDIYTFFSDSSYLKYQSEYLDPNGYEGYSYNVKYSYKNNILIKNDFDTLTVAFKNNQLYLYPKYSLSYFTKIK